MFNPEQLLRQMVGDALSGNMGGKRHKRSGSLLGGMSGGTKAKLGLGLLGIAVAAYQHYQGQSAAPQPLAGASAGAGSPPPPPATLPTAPPPPPAPAASAARGEQAMHLLRTMITAAHADGLIDDGERQAIVARARTAGMDEDDLQALDAEIRAPLTLKQLAVRTPPGQRDEVYAAALVAITADTESERQFLDQLAAELSLDESRRRDIHAQLGLA